MLCWLFYDNGTGPIFGFGNPWDDTSSSSANRGVALEINETEITVFFKYQGNSHTRHLSHPIKLSGRGWKFVGASYDHHSSKAKLWVDGDDVETKDLRERHKLATKGTVIMGKSLEIKITQMHVYNLALTQEQIQTIQKRTKIPGLNKT